MKKWEYRITRYHLKDFVREEESARTAFHCDPRGSAPSTIFPGMQATGSWTLSTKRAKTGGNGSNGEPIRMS
jgi:hypothetical protein